MRTSAVCLCFGAAVFVAKPAVAQDQPIAADAQIEIAPRPPNPDSSTTGGEPAARGEPPPLPTRPRHKGVVLESTLGILAFAGQFGHIAPPASFTHAQLGYEIFSWLMLFGEAELAFSDTSESQDPSHSRAFPLWGFGGGARAGTRIKDVGAFVQADVGALTARVPHDALAYLGFRGAESLGAQYGGRIGAEWYQRDRHFALIAQGGPRVAQGFSKSGPANLPLMWDAAAGLRYTF